MSPAKYNYQIYNKELIAIVKAFEEQRLELIGADGTIEVFIDYRTLEQFITTKQLNRRQARQAKFLTEFNFKIILRPSKDNGKADSLIRRTQDIDKIADLANNNRALLKKYQLSDQVIQQLAIKRVAITDPRSRALAQRLAVIKVLSEDELLVEEQIQDIYKEDKLAQAIITAITEGYNRLPLAIGLETYISLLDYRYYKGHITIRNKTYILGLDN